MTLERFLCFNLGTEEFGIPLHSVKEVLAIPEVTPIPFAPSHFVGIMNLRGQVITLVDLRSKFGIKATMSPETSVIICDIKTTSIGVVVDSVNSVISPTLEEISPKPEILDDGRSNYITSVFRIANRMILFLDIDKALNGAEKSYSKNFAQPSSTRKAS